MSFFPLTLPRPWRIFCIYEQDRQLTRLFPVRDRHPLGDSSPAVGEFGPGRAPALLPSLRQRGCRHFLRQLLSARLPRPLRLFRPGRINGLPVPRQRQPGGHFPSGGKRADVAGFILLFVPGNNLHQTISPQHFSSPRAVPFRSRLIWPFRSLSGVSRYRDCGVLCFLSAAPLWFAR